MQSSSYEIKSNNVFMKGEKETYFLIIFYLWISGSNSFSCISAPTSIEHLCRESGPRLMSGDEAKSGELLGGVDRRSAIVYLLVIFKIWIVVSQVSLKFSAFPYYYSSCIDVSVESVVIVFNIKCTSSPTLSHSG